MNIREARKNMGMTQQQLSEKMGVNVRWIQKLESGEINMQNITFLNAIKLISALTPFDDEEIVIRDILMIAKRMFNE